MLAEVPNYIIQADWGALVAAAGTVSAGLVAAARLISSQLGKTDDATQKRHAELREDAKEARTENRLLSQAILKIQSETVKTLAAMQQEIKVMAARMPGDGRPATPRGHAPAVPNGEFGCEQDGPAGH